MAVCRAEDELPGMSSSLGLVAEGRGRAWAPSPEPAFGRGPRPPASAAYGLSPSGRQRSGSLYVRPSVQVSLRAAGAGGEWVCRCKGRGRQSPEEGRLWL